MQGVAVGCEDLAESAHPSDAPVGGKAADVAPVAAAVASGTPEQTAIRDLYPVGYGHANGCTGPQAGF